jgi:hypothetical protein
MGGMLTKASTVVGAIQSAFETEGHEDVGSDVLRAVLEDEQLDVPASAFEAALEFLASKRDREVLIDSADWEEFEASLPAVIEKHV